MDGPRPVFGTVSGYVLAGGRSSRMGRDKARLPWGSATLIESAASAVKLVSHSVAIVGGDPVPGLRHVPDVEAGFGPVSGIAAALRDSMADWALVVACDMPGLTRDFLATLIESAGVDGAVPVTPDGRQHPLCALWAKRSLPRFEHALATGEHTLRNVIAPLDVTFLPVTDASVLRNVNTPEEYAAALAGARE